MLAEETAMQAIPASKMAPDAGVDTLLVFTVTALLSLGIVMVFSATVAATSGFPTVAQYEGIL